MKVLQQYYNKASLKGHGFATICYRVKGHHSSLGFDKDVPETEELWLTEYYMHDFYLFKVNGRTKSVTNYSCEQVNISFISSRVICFLKIYIYKLGNTFCVHL